MSLPNEIGAGFKTYQDNHCEKTVYEFFVTYIRRMKPDLTWKKLLSSNKNTPFPNWITPSDIAYVLAIIKNGKEMWDEARSPSTSLEKKARPLFSAGEGIKRESGVSMWNKAGLEYYYTVERNWKKVYNDKDQLSVLITGWENWEPKDKSKKDALRTHWSDDEEEDNKKITNKSKPDKREWWEEEDEGYNSDVYVMAEYNIDERRSKKHEKGKNVLVHEEKSDEGQLFQIGGGISNEIVGGGGREDVQVINDKSREDDDVDDDEDNGKDTRHSDRNNK